jgi:hypothetical protein
VPGQPFELPAGNNSNSPLAPAVADRFVFVSDPTLILEEAEQPSDMFTFTLDQTTGALSAISTTQLGLGAGEQVITPSGKFLYLETASIQSNGFRGPAELAGFQVNGDGSLTPLSQAPVQSPQQPAIINMSPNGSHYGVTGSKR